MVNFKKEWHKSAVELAESGMSWRKIALKLGIPKSSCSDFLRSYFKGKKPIDMGDKFTVHRNGIFENNERVLFISDIHAPYHHPDTLLFLKYLKEKYDPTRVVSLGDELDKHGLSFHDHDPDLYSAGHELVEGIKFIKQLHELFPVMDIIESNHGSLVWRKAKTHGIPRHYIKSYNEVLGVGDGWKWSFDLTLTLPNGQKCYIHHGKTNKVIQLSQQMGMNAVQGHYHESFSIDYWGNPTGLYWGMQCGCLIDDNALAFSYNNVNIKRPIIGTGLIIDSLPVLEPMVLDKNGRWIFRK